MTLLAISSLVFVPIVKIEAKTAGSSERVSLLVRAVSLMASRSKVHVL